MVVLKAYRKSVTRDPGRLQVGPPDPKIDILGKTQDPRPKSGARDPKIVKWDPV